MMNDYSYIMDYVYQKSSLANFLDFVKLDQPSFCIEEINKGTFYYTCEHHAVHASMNMRELMSLVNTYKLDTNKAFIETLIKESHKYLDNYFIKYIDAKAETDEIIFKNGNLTFFSRFFRENARFSFLTKSKNLKKAANLLGIIKGCYEKIVDYVNDSSGYAIVSQEMAQFIASFPQFKRSLEIKETSGTYPIGHLEGILNVNIPNMTIFVNPNINQNVMYFGTIKKSTGLSDKFFYYAAPNSIVEYQSSPEDFMNISKNYVMNLFYNIVESNQIKSRYKKIILEI